MWAGLRDTLSCIWPSSQALRFLFMGAPTFPDVGRFWKICEKHAVTIFYTAPTAIRALEETEMRFQTAMICRSFLAWYCRRQINLLGCDTTGVGKSVPIVDTWWQTETGGARLATSRYYKHQAGHAQHQYQALMLIL